MSRLRPITLLLPVALIAMGLAMYGISHAQRNTAVHADDRIDASTRMLVSLLDEETGLRGYLLTGKDEFLAPYRSGVKAAAQAEAQVRAGADGDVQTLSPLSHWQGLERSWQKLAAAQIAAKRADPGYRGPLADALERKNLVDRLRAIGAALDLRLHVRRDDDLARATRTSVVLVLLLLAAMGAGTYAVVRRETRRRRALYRHDIDYRTTQREYTDVVAVVRSEGEAHNLLKRHLELSVHGARATVLTANNSDNRLEAGTEVAGASVLAGRLEGAEPSSCLAVHLGRGHRHVPAAESLLTCDLCGAAPGRTACEPLLVGGQVIGAVLLEHDETLDEEAERRLADSVVQAAPVLANLRNLAIAERRASTDALTGLPNRRAVHDALTRMAAQAARSGQPLAAVAMDLDRFKDINDRFGHEMGDTVLAQVGALLAMTVRGSDLVGRVGGEEFIVLAPDTGPEGALILAENLRAALERESVAGLDRGVTGSFGVAVIPTHAATPDALLRLADRALYTAKGAGRNRVHLTAPPAESAV
ncbi:MAG TPA: diguanylate cyclase [Baekduia sp.]